MRRFLSGTLAAGLVLLTLPAFADDAAQRQAIDGLIQPLIKNKLVQGLSLGVVQNGRAWFRGYGTTGGEGARTPDEKTVFEIGSISKVFTGVLLGELAQRGTVRLEDPVQRHLPNFVEVPRGRRAITLLDLTTHSSGLPRMPGNFRPQDRRNPYADYSVRQMYQFLTAHRLRRDPGAKYAYSNLGVGLLGHTLSRAARKKDYQALLVERICAPLGMRDTRIVLTPSMKARLAQPHGRGGKPSHVWDIPTLAGAGGIRSTIHDMLIFLRANLRTPRAAPASLRGALDAARRSRFPIAKGRAAMGLGWHMRTRRGIVWHNGATGGYHAYLGLNRKKGVGVVVLCNTADGIVTRLGVKVLDVLLGRKVTPLETRKVPQAIKVDPKVLETYVGRYQLLPGFVLTITLEKGQLYLQATRQPKFPIFAETKRKFFLKVVPAKVTFKVGKDGKVTGLVLHQAGRNMPATRLPKK